MNDKTTDAHPVAQRLNDEMLEALDEELELELDDDRLDAAVEHITERQPKETIDRDAYDASIGEDHLGIDEIVERETETTD